MTEPTKKPASTYVDFGVHGGSEWAKNSERATVYNDAGEAVDVDGVLAGGGMKISAGYFLPELKDDYRIGLGGQVVAAGALNGVDYYKIDTDGQSYNGEHVKNARTIGVGLLFNLTAGITLDPVEANSGAAEDAVASDPKPASFEVGLLIGPSYLAGYMPLNNGVNGALPGTQPLQGLALLVGGEATYFLGVGEGKGDLGINLRFTSTRGKTAEGALREEEERVPLRYLQVGITGRIGSISSKPKAEPAPALVEPVVVAPPEPTPEPKTAVTPLPPEPTPPVVAEPLPDADGDGMDDAIDDCPKEHDGGYKGMDALPGCPEPKPIIPTIQVTEKKPEPEPVPAPTEVTIPEREWSIQTISKDGLPSQEKKVGFVVGAEKDDNDGDGLTNREEQDLANNGLDASDPQYHQTAGPGATDPNNPDTDGDGIWDKEDSTRYNPIAGKVLNPDVDGDGYYEALDQDSDSDGTPDGIDGTDGFPKNAKRRDPKNKSGTEELDFREMVDITTDLKARGEIALTDITFEHNKATLTDDAERILTQAASQLKQDDLKNLKIEIGGHANTKGSASHNLTLSGDRAAAVRDFLILQGVPEKNLKSEGYGESLPVKSDGEQCSTVAAKGEGDQVCEGAEDFELSRRVVFKVID